MCLSNKEQYLAKINCHSEVLSFSKQGIRFSKHHTDMQIRKYENSGYRIKLRGKIRISEGIFSLACLDAVTPSFISVFSFLHLPIILQSSPVNVSL